jgi:hypothetical protein
VRLMLSLFVAVLLTACADPITSGAVVDKEFTPAHIDVHAHYRTESYCDYGYDYFTESYKFDCNKTRSVFSHNHDHHIPDKWTVTFEGENEKGKLKRRTVEVTQGAYTEAFLGQQYTVSE